MRMVVSFVLGILLVGCNPVEKDTSGEAKAAFKSYIAAINSGRIDTAAAFYDDAPGFHWIERGKVQYDKGADAAASLKQLSKSYGKMRMTVDNVRVARMTEGSALVSAHFDYGMLNESGKLEVAFDGWMTVGMVKRKEGWRIAGGQTGPGKAAE